MIPITKQRAEHKHDTPLKLAVDALGARPSRRKTRIIDCTMMACAASITQYGEILFTGAIILRRRDARFAHLCTNVNSNKLSENIKLDS